MLGLQPNGFPHSEICGSIRICQSPQLIAAYHVFLRLKEPRHPPCALITFFLCVFLRTCCSPLIISMNYCPFGLADIAVSLCVLLFKVRYQIFNELCVFGSAAKELRRVFSLSISRKEVFQPHLPVRLPCYDLAPVIGFALGRSLRSRTSGTPNSHGLTGGVYKARERIHRAMADARLLANPTSWRRVSASNPN